MSKFLFIGAIFVIFVYFLASGIFFKKTYPDRILIPDAPIQNSVSNQSPVYIDGVKLDKLAKYQGIVLIEGKREYSDFQSNIIPLDLIFTWGQLSQQSVRDSIRYSQSNRWYFFYNNSDKISIEEISKNSANTHIIPLNKSIQKTVDDINTGDIVYFEGHLVSVDFGQDKIMKSSLSRTDKGAGACEVLLINKIENISSQF